MGRLAPWDTLPFYLLPREFTVTDNGATQLVIPGDPNRRVIIASCRQGQANWTLSTLSGIITSGIVVGNSLPPLILTLDQHGPMVCGEWYGQADSLGSVISVITQSQQRRMPDQQDPFAESEGSVDAILQRSADDIRRYNRYLARWPESAPLQIDNKLSVYQSRLN